jgi:hypothetical protein
MRRRPSAWSRLLVAIMTVATLMASIYALAAPYHSSN